MRRPIIAGNWKMNKTKVEARELASRLRRDLHDVFDRDIVLCPPFTVLFAVWSEIEGSQIEMGAQNMVWEGPGAYTGEICGEMIKETGCQYVILGHSERRQYFKETDAIINKKLLKAFFYRLNPIVCVGETLKERESGRETEVVSAQIEGCFAGLSEEAMVKTVVAYEPVWAIGTGRTATPEQANEMHEYIRTVIAKLFGKDCAEKVRIQYGGSVKPDNVDEIMAQPDIDGALVGGASLKPEPFARIVRFENI
ncbi:MAG: triose-phosphate isomerase [Candidatus Theseobacter exili]|nr:triose-phosphate isomerase [Candidatus Theseobacter exili]